MSPQSQRRSLLVSWIFVGLLFALCGVLGVLQYRWIGEVSMAARDRMRASLQASLDRASREFQTELTSAVRAIAPDPDDSEPGNLVAQISERYQAWKTEVHARLFRGVGFAVREGESIVLLRPDADGRFVKAEWPSEWTPLRDFWISMTRDGRGFRGNAPAPYPYPASLFELPLFTFQGPPSPDRERRNLGWLIFDVDLKYVGETVIPELLQRHLGSTGLQEYQFELVSRGDNPELIYSSDRDPNLRISSGADASVGIGEIAPDLIRGRGRGGRGGGRGGRGGPGIEGPRVVQAGHWELSVRHRAGSLEAVVGRTRLRNLAVTGGLMILILASAGALLSFTRRSQRLAELQMNFVAGVSHELRTPLTVINTAAYNLQNKMSRNPEQVVKYGGLIRQESGRLKELVEQVLSFAGARAGRLTQETQPLAVEDLIESSMEASKAVIEGSHFVVEKDIAPDLPLISGDSRALQHAVQNLLTNAVKYGGGDSNWIGVSAHEAVVEGEQVVEIRVADRGPGIPADEQRQIFDPFYRGKRAIQDQVHGTGLGLTLVKEIVTAHRGNIDVRSEPGKGTEFILRIPAAATQEQDEFANTSGRG